MVKYNIPHDVTYKKCKNIEELSDHITTEGNELIFPYICNHRGWETVKRYNRLRHIIPE